MMKISNFNPPVGGQISNLQFRTQNFVKCQRGFTLLEIIVVIAIIAILSVGLMTILNPITQFQKANDTRRKSDLATIQKVLEQYYGDAGKYPASSNDYRIKGLDGNVVGWGSSFQPYINVLPRDPKSSKKYVYYSTPDGQAYFLYASLDRGNDSGACNKSGVCPGLTNNNIPVSSCGETCSYGVTSPNVSP